MVDSLVNDNLKGKRNQIIMECDKNVITYKNSNTLYFLIKRIVESYKLDMLK